MGTLRRRYFLGSTIIALVIVGFLWHGVTYPYGQEGDGFIPPREIVMTFTQTAGQQDKPVVVQQVNVDDLSGAIRSRRTVTCKIDADGTRVRFAGGFHGMNVSYRRYFWGLCDWQAVNSSASGERWTFLWGLVNFQTSKSHIGYIISRGASDIARLREDELLAKPVTTRISLAESLFAGQPGADAPYCTRDGYVEVSEFLLQ